LWCEVPAAALLLAVVIVATGTATAPSTPDNYLRLTLPDSASKIDSMGAAQRVVAGRWGTASMPWMRSGDGRSSSSGGSGSSVSSGVIGRKPSLSSSSLMRRDARCFGRSGGRIGSSSNAPASGDSSGSSNSNKNRASKRTSSSRRSRREHESGPVSQKSILKSVVKVYCTEVRPNFALPWQMEQQESSFSSGFVIPGQRILTNAHGVAWHNVVRVRKHGDSRKFVASVEHVAHECDLAILKVEDPQFWQGLEALEIGDLPDLQDNIMVVGYPQGGDRISVTQGIVSRVEMGAYSHSGEYLLMIQIDAAINSGNSGGPALDPDGKIVGVAFQSLDDADNIGYIIPVPIIDHFLSDINLHGRYTGFCRLGVSWQTTENEALRQYLKLGSAAGEAGKLEDGEGREEELVVVESEAASSASEAGDLGDRIELASKKKVRHYRSHSETAASDSTSYEEDEEQYAGVRVSGGMGGSTYSYDTDYTYTYSYTEEDEREYTWEEILDMSDDTGVLVTHVEPILESAKVLQSGDVIVGIDGVPIASDGTVPFRGEERVLFSYLLRSKFTGDSVNITYIRDGERKTAPVKLEFPSQLVPWYMYDKSPSYLVHAGLVMTPLSVPYLMAEFGHRWQRYAPVGLLESAMYGQLGSEEEEVVVLSQVLASDLTSGYEDIHNVKVLTVNGETVKNLKHLLTMLESNKEPFLKFQVGNSPGSSMMIVIDAEKADRQTERILTQNKIPDRMSNDLRQWAVKSGMATA